ncbi:carcinoembryonic antigen-related cell adhesion molecule 5-like isoform X2 [Xyrichtys novacula]|uniref:Carcinoembryonic antigen-related cell adhesion molecule 5-like isoform X2 n=1 Tax=Xyrichtys novacula TaxID=13765 RepID=A0AAV1HC98_XYRNO|nr:carcinoembryonic antigen-related cell adhesion molecule 5-like isoform X2 [Xyrichtys novacula]
MDLLAFKSLLFLLCFIGCCAGEDILPEGPLDVVLGKNLTVPTLLKNPTYSFIVWNFNNGGHQIHVITIGSEGLSVNTPYEGRVAIDPTNGFLTLTAVKSEDSGDYSINVISSSGATKTEEIAVRVLEPVSAVVIKSNLPEAVEHNDTVILTCSAKGSFLKFSWLKGAAPLVADGKRVSIKDEELSSTLTFVNVLRTDLVGSIICVATNKLETEKSAPFNLTVHHGPDKATISPAKPPQFLQSGSSFNLTCAAASSPPATFNWYHNQKEMKSSGPVLTLAEIEKQGLGRTAEQFTCTATNAKTKRVVASSGVTFAVVDPILGATLTGPTGTLIAGNSTANLTCKAASGTVKTRTWTKDGKPLTPSSRVVFAIDMSSVMINPLQKEDNGEFTCQLTNPVTQSKASYKMVVNDAVTLTCSAASVPAANFTWKFNGTLTNVKTPQYVIEQARYKNTGTYTCEASNPVTKKTTKSTHTMSVKEEGTLNEGLSDGAIAGIVIAILVALGAAIGLIMYCRQKVPVESPY